MEENRFKYRCWHTYGKQIRPSIPGMIYDNRPGDCLKWLADGEDIIAIMQCTGSFDKVGEEIYEGDIIQSKSKMVLLHNNKETGNFKIESYEVRWEQEKSRWGRWDGCKFELLSGLQQEYLSKWYSVIGNIYENPELLR